MRRCQTCKLIKNESEFGPKQKRCRACCSAKWKKYYERNKDKLKEHKKAYYLENADKMRQSSRNSKRKKADIDRQKFVEWMTSDPDGATLYLLEKKKQVSIRGMEERRRLKKNVIEHYGGCCACCGESRLEFLAIDHVNGGGNKARERLGSRGAGPPFYRLLRQNNYPDGYRVLCHNCNFSYGLYGYCPHQTNRAD